MYADSSFAVEIVLVGLLCSMLLLFLQAVEVDNSKQDEVVSLLLEAGQDTSALMADDAGNTALAIVERVLKKDQ